MCDFHLVLLDFIFIKKTLIFVVPLKKFYLLKRFTFWRLKAWNWKIEISKNWNLGILRLDILDWNLELEIWIFEIFVTWNFEHEILKFEILKDLKLEIYNL